MNRRLRSLIKHVLQALIYGVLAALLIGLGAYIYVLESRPDLKVWHTADLDAEFAAADANRVTDLNAYLETENGVMQQLQAQVYDRIPPADQRQIVRYHSGSRMDPASYSQNWNRTFELIPEKPVAAALLLHGLSDSPYSMRAVAEALHARNVWTLGLRMPGHGTAPTGLVHVEWTDFVAAVRIGIRHLNQRVGDRPLYIVGYSNGAALAVEYSLTLLEGIVLPRVDALVLLSPAIGVAPVAALARWQGRLGNLAGFEKLAWNSIELEFDPYKYNSFPVNAGDQIYRLTSDIERRIANLSAAHGLRYFPKTLAFLSVVDATVPPEALLDKLFMKFEDGGHELVLFDVNRHAEAEPLLKKDPESLVKKLFENPALPFDLTLLTNTEPSTGDIMARHKYAHSPVIQDNPLNLTWPATNFSLSHVAVPFPPNDPVYGAFPAPDDQGITLGAISIRGERGLLQIPDNYFLRLRHNPFFDYMIERMLQFLELETPVQE